MNIPDDTFKDAVALIKGLEYKYLVDLASILNSEIALQKRAAERDAELKRQKAQQDAIQEIRKIAREAGLDIAELASAKPRKQQLEQKAVRNPAKPKFRSPDGSGKPWSGRGLPPKWFKEAKAKGFTDDELLIPA